MPDTTKHGGMIPAIVKVYDQFGRKYSAPVSLWADRMEKVDSGTRKKAPRRNLLDHPDRGYDHTVTPEDEA